MEVKNNYKVLNQQVYNFNEFKIIPVRYKDRYKIMTWRNDQLYHLRQIEKISKENQDLYFKKILLPQKKHDKPNQILFSLFHKSIFVGYGGLVHINWLDKSAEVSFVMDTQLEKKFFSEFWDAFLNLLEMVLEDLNNLNVIYTYAFDLRPKIYKVLEKKGFYHEKDETYLKDNQIINVKIHKKFFNGE